MALTAEDFIAVAEREIGYTEEKNGATKYGIWYGKRHKNPAYDKAAWCDMFLVWCAYQAAGEDGVDIVGDFAYTPWHAGWFARQGRFGDTPRKGAIAFFDWEGSKNLYAIDHVGVVLATDSLGRVVTIEGNTANRVAKRYRSMSTIVGYGYPKFAAAAKNVSVKPASAKPATTKVSVPPYPLPKGHVLGYPKTKLIHDGTENAKYKSAVRTAQARLKTRGWAIVDDGIFGPKTTKVTKAFQAEKGLEVDGRIGPITWNALWTAPIT